MRRDTATPYAKLALPRGRKLTRKALSYREPYTPAQSRTASRSARASARATATATATARSVPDWRDVVSPAAYDFIVGWETGGRAYYEEVIKGRPVWPGVSSGITIGCGYDLGYHTAAEFSADWSGRLPAAAMTRLGGVIGFKTVEPDRAAKVARARQLVVLFSDIVVAWDAAIVQFDERKLPALVGQLEGALPNLDRLHPHCYGALLSLVFNRGTPFHNTSPRFVEMVEIHRLMSEGTRDAFEKIPDQFRAMTRIWGAGSGLARRRLGEADLFVLGLREADLLTNVALLRAPTEIDLPDWASRRPAGKARRPRIAAPM